MIQYTVHPLTKLSQTCQNWRKSRTKCWFFCIHVSCRASLVFLWRRVSMGEAGKHSKVSKQVVLSFCVAGVALCDIPTCLITCRKNQNWRKSRTKCSFWCSHVSRLESLVCPWLRLVYGGSCALHTLPFTLHTPHFTFCTLHFPTRHLRLYTPHSTLYTTLYTFHSSLLTLHFTLHSTLLHFTLHTLHYTLLALHSTLHTPHFPLHTPHFALLTPRYPRCTISENH